LKASEGITNGIALVSSNHTVASVARSTQFVMFAAKKWTLLINFGDKMVFELNNARMVSVIIQNEMCLLTVGNGSGSTDVYCCTLHWRKDQIINILKSDAIRAIVTFEVQERVMKVFTLVKNGIEIFRPLMMWSMLVWTLSTEQNS
uniref:BBS1 domain-containing protein n=1 Tax=Anisakis simplex TaxID=6269 RepID=A0A0M3K023_ANISI